MPHWAIYNDRGTLVAVVIGEERLARLVVAGVNREASRKLSRAKRAGLL
jgi:hypothetical protein